MIELFINRLIEKSGCSPSDQDIDYLNLIDLFKYRNFVKVTKDIPDINDTTIVFRKFVSSVGSLYKLSGEGEEGEVLSKDHLAFLDDIDKGWITN